MLDFFLESFSHSSCALILPEFGRHLKEILISFFYFFGCTWTPNLYHFDVAPAGPVKANQYCSSAPTREKFSLPAGRRWIEGQKRLNL